MVTISRITLLDGDIFTFRQSGVTSVSSLAVLFGSFPSWCPIDNWGSWWRESSFMTS